MLFFRIWEFMQPPITKLHMGHNNKGLMCRFVQITHRFLGDVLILPLYRFVSNLPKNREADFKWKLLGYPYRFLGGTWPYWSCIYTNFFQIYRNIARQISNESFQILFDLGISHSLTDGDARFESECFELIKLWDALCTTHLRSRSSFSRPLNPYSAT